MLYFTSWTQQLNWVQPKALLKYHIHITFYSALRTSFFFHPLPVQAFLPVRYLPANSLPRSVSFSCSVPFARCSFPDACTVVLPVSLKRCCPLLFTLDPNDLLPAKGCPMSLWPPRAKAKPGEKVHSLIVLLPVFYNLYGWHTIEMFLEILFLGNSIPWKFSLPNIPFLSFSIPPLYSLFPIDFF